MEWTLSPPQSMIGTFELSTSKPNGIERMPSPQRNHTTPTQSKEATPTTKAQKLIHTPWTSTLSALKNSPKKKERNASRKADASDAGNLDITQETAPCSQVTTITPTPTQKPHQRNLKNSGRWQRLRKSWRYNKERK